MWKEKREKWRWTLHSRLISFEYRIVSIFPVSFFHTLTIFFYNEMYKQNLQKYKFKIGMKIDKLFIIHRRNVKMSKRPKSSLSKIHSPISLSFQHPVLTTQGKSLDNVGFTYTHTHTHTHTHIHIYSLCKLSQEALAWYRLLLVRLETRCKTKAV